MSSDKIDGEAGDKIDVRSDVQTLEKPLQVYSRRKNNERAVSLESSQVAQPSDILLESNLSQPGNPSNTDPPIALRKGTRSCVA